ncbi:hypothetical protein J4423_02835 [Candidatus Pacearchaeota archaeon]|nr:hypothetical protein [Candidatus Pacearchaeota archaeon]
MVKNYQKETEAETLKGTITCGSKVGYSGKEKFSLGQITNIVEKTHNEIASKDMKSISCIISNGKLVMNTSKGIYKEEVYLLDFLWSPLSIPIDKKTFYQTLVEYLDLIGTAMRQERMYLDFENKTYVFKRINP